MTGAAPFVPLLHRRHEKVRIDTVIGSGRSDAIEINREGRLQVLGVEPANRGSASSWKGVLRRLEERGLHSAQSVGKFGQPRGESWPNT